MTQLTEIGLLLIVTAASIVAIGIALKFSRKATRVVPALGVTSLWLMFTIAIFGTGDLPVGDELYGNVVAYLGMLLVLVALGLLLYKKAPNIALLLTVIGLAFVVVGYCYIFSATTEEKIDPYEILYGLAAIGILLASMILFVRIRVRKEEGGEITDVEY